MTDPSLLHNSDIMNGRLFDLRIFRTKEELPVPCRLEGFGVLIHPIPTIITRYRKPYIQYPVKPHAIGKTDRKLINYQMQYITQDENQLSKYFEMPKVNYSLLQGKDDIHQIPTNTYHQEVLSKIFVPKFIDEVSYFYDLNSLNINYICNPRMVKQYHHIYGDKYLVIDYSDLRQHAVDNNLVLRKRLVNRLDRRNISLIVGYNGVVGYPLAQYYSNIVELIEGEVQFFGPETLEACLNIDGSYSVEYFNQLQEVKTMDYYLYNTNLMKIYIYDGDINILKNQGFVVNPILKDSITVIVPSSEIKWCRTLNYSNKRKASFRSYSLLGYWNNLIHSKNSIYPLKSVSSGETEDFNYRMIQEFYAKGLLYTNFPGMYSPKHELLSAIRATLSTVTNQGNNTAGIFDEKLDSDHGNTIISRKYDAKLDVYYKTSSIHRSRYIGFTPLHTNNEYLNKINFMLPTVSKTDNKVNLNEFLYFKNGNNNRSANRQNIITNLIVNAEKLVKHVQLPNINYEQHLKKNLLTQFKTTATEHIKRISTIQNTNVIRAEYYDTTCYKHREFMVYIFSIYAEKIADKLKKSNIVIADNEISISKTVTFQTFKHFSDVSQRMAYLIWRDFKAYDDVFLTKEEFCDKYHEYSLTYECHEYPTGKIASMIKRTMNLVYDKELNFRKVDSIIEPTVSQKIIPIHHEANASVYDRALLKETYEFTIDQKNVAIRARYIKPLNEVPYDTSKVVHYPIVRNPFMMFQIHGAEWCRSTKFTFHPVRSSGCTWVVDGTSTTSSNSLCINSVFGAMCNNDPIPSIPIVTKKYDVDEECTDDICEGPVCGSGGGGFGGGGGGRPGTPSCDVRFHKCTGGGGPWYGDLPTSGGGGGGGGSIITPDWTPGELNPTPHPKDPPPIYGMIYFANTIAGHIPSILREIPYIPVLVEPLPHIPKSIIFPIKPIIEKIKRPEYKIELEMIPYWILKQSVESGAVHEIHASALNSRHIYHTRFFMPEFTKFESSNRAFMQESFVTNVSIILPAADKLKRDSSGHLSELARWLEFTKMRTLVSVETELEILEDISETTNIILQSYVNDARIYSETVSMMPDIIRVANYVSELNVIVEPSSNLGTSKSMIDLLFKISNNLRDKIKVNLLIPSEITDVSLQFVSKVEALNKFIYPFKTSLGVEDVMDRFKSLGLIDKIIPMIYSTSFPSEEFNRVSKLLKDNYGIKEIMINDANSIAMTDEWTKYFRDNKLS